MQENFKKKLPFLIVPLFLVLFALLIPTTVLAETYIDPVSGITWTYTVNEDDSTTCTITGCSQTDGEIEIPSTIDVDGNTYTVTAIESKIKEKNIFGSTINSGVTSITIPDSVTTIGDFAFYDCINLASITIPDSVTTIGKNAFCICKSLTSVTMGKNVESIEEKAFGYCKFESIVIPDTVTYIGEYAFFDCSSLKEINVDSENKNYSSEDGVLFNKGKTILIKYPAANTRTEYTIPDSVTTIEDYAFHYCSKLTTIDIPDSVTTIGNYAFYYCSKLTSITLGNFVTAIEDYTFYNCSGLTSITLGKSVTLFAKPPHDPYYALDSAGTYERTKSFWRRYI